MRRAFWLNMSQLPPSQKIMLWGKYESQGASPLFISMCAPVSRETKLTV